MTFSEKPTMPKPGLVACLAVGICVLISVIGCGVARFDLAVADEVAETVLSTSVGDSEQADIVADSLPTVHKNIDALTQHHRTLPHRMRSLTPSRWWHHAHSWPTARPQLDIDYPGASDASPTGRTLLTHFCVSRR